MSHNAQPGGALRREKQLGLSNQKPQTRYVKIGTAKKESWMSVKSKMSRKSRKSKTSQYLLAE